MAHRLAAFALSLTCEARSAAQHGDSAHHEALADFDEPVIAKELLHEKITAIVRPEKLEPLKEALFAAQVAA